MDQVEKQIATTYVDPILTVSKSSTVKRTFIYQRELLPAVVIDKFSDMFRLLFHKTVIWPVICIAIVADIWFSGRQTICVRPFIWRLLYEVPELVWLQVVAWKCACR